MEAEFLTNEQATIYYFYDNTMLDGEAVPLEAAEAARGIPLADDWF